MENFTLSYIEEKLHVALKVRVVDYPNFSDDLQAMSTFSHD